MHFESVNFSYQARYAVLGKLDENTQAIWFVLHGYGQLAQYFIRKFSILEKENIVVVAPEGLSKFYLEDVNARMQSKNNRVGASWMTKENREEDIQNYVRYLDAIHAHLVKGAPIIPITFLGFSQGAATVSRWATLGRSDFNRLILWAGVFPPDMNFEQGSHILQKKETHLVYGVSDPFLNDSTFTEMNVISEKLGISPVISTFEGGHDIDTETLKKFI